MLKKNPENADGRTDGRMDIATAEYVRFSNGRINSNVPGDDTCKD